MSNCLNCEKDAGAGFSTCSSECATAWRNRGVQIEQPRIEAPKQELNHGALTYYELAGLIGVTPHTVQAWSRAGKIPCDRSRGRRSTRYDLDAVRLALGDQTQRMISAASPSPLPEVPQAQIDPELSQVCESYLPPKDKLKPQQAVPEAVSDVQEIGHTLRMIAKEMLLEKADLLESSGKLQEAYRMLKRSIVVDQKLAEVFQ